MVPRFSPAHPISLIAIDSSALTQGHFSDDLTSPLLRATTVPHLQQKVPSLHPLQVPKCIPLNSPRWRCPSPISPLKTGDDSGGLPHLSPPILTSSGAAATYGAFLEPTPSYPALRQPCRSPTLADPPISHASQVTDTYGSCLSALKRVDQDNCCHKV